MNTLYYGDNLNILREYIGNETVDLIYLDPPFNSNRNYNVLFRNESGTEAESQITAFEDTWHWNASAEETYRELILQGDDVAKMVESFRAFIGENQMMAYLVMMAIRLKELHRVLKPTGSLYLHCDPTASHYLKILLDTIFGAHGFKNEIIWRRTTNTGSSKSIAKMYPWNSDTILFYVKNPSGYTFKHERADYSEKYKSRFTKKDARGYYYPDNLKTYSAERFEVLKADNRIEYTSKGTPRIKNYLHEGKGVILDNIWDDIQTINSQAQERLGYPTQKPVALLERILKASSNEGDVVLDPFCGCGTTIAAAQNLNRQWIGIDVTHLAVGLQKFRLKDTYKLTAGTDYKVVGQPEDLDGAKNLAENDRYGFQWWVLPLVGARSLGAETGKRDGKKGSDKGIDGTMVFVDDNSGKAKRIVLQVKSGKVKSGDIRDLKGVVERENAAIGVFITLQPPSKDMITEAVTAGFYHSDHFNKDYPRLQILTVEDILAGHGVNMPSESVSFKKATKETFSHKAQPSIFDNAEDS